VKAAASLAIGCLGLALIPPLSAADAPWPAISGELTGAFTALQLPGAPTLRWKSGIQLDGTGARRTTIEAEGPGTRLGVVVAFDADQPMRWRLDSAEFDLATWFPVLLARLNPESAGMAAHGTLSVAGDGSWHDGWPSGNARIRIQDARLDDPVHHLSIEGIALDLGFEDLAARRTGPGQILTWTSARYEGIEVGAGQLTFALDGGQVQVEQISAAIWGGEIRLAAFAFALDRMEMSVIARLLGIDVAHLLPLLPPVVSEARGRLNGTVSIRRDASGIQIGAGRLELQPGEPVELRLAPTPGLLSRSLPSSVLKHYPGLGKIEAGELPVLASRLEVAFTPGGDQEGRTASVYLAGGPTDPELRAPIELVVNVRGPLESLIKLGTSSRLRFGAEP